MEVEKQEGFLVLTIYLPRRRWYGKSMSCYTIDARIPFQNTGAELCWDIAKGWMKPQREYRQLRWAANIQSFDAS